MIKVVSLLVWLFKSPKLSEHMKLPFSRFHTPVSQDLNRRLACSLVHCAVGFVDTAQSHKLEV